MANKEKLEQLTGYIDKLKKLSENIYEREIYPVSFFSQAFDITNKIQDSLQQIEMEQIELFDKQMKEHQAQIRNIQSVVKEHEPVPTIPVIEKKSSETSSSIEDVQTVLSITNHHTAEKEIMVEDKNAETVQIPPMIKEQLSTTTSSTDSSQAILSKTDHHITEKQKMIEDNNAETTQISPMIEKQLLKTTSFVDLPQTILSETSQQITKEEVNLTKKTEIQPPSLEEKLQTVGNSLDKKFEKKILSDLKKAFTINDRFRFCRELFLSNENLMNQTFTELNNMESFTDSIAYLKEYFSWDWEDQVTTEFISMIEKRFN